MRPRWWTPALAAPAWAGGLLLLARLPAALAWAPCLGVWRGPLGWALVGLAAAMVAAERLRGRVVPPAPGPRALGLTAAAGLLGLALYHASGLRVSGDEPHYLLMAQSLLREGDLDLRDNFERGDYREYLPALPAPHYAAPRRDGRPYPGHSPGLPALLAPAYAVGGRTACVVLLALLAAALADQVRVLAQRVTGEDASARVAWAAAVGPPVVYYAFHVYTEVPSALALAVALRLLTAPAPGAGMAAAALAAALASVLPWLHVKMAPAAAALGVVAGVRLRGRALAAFTVAAAAGAAGYLGYYASVFGRPTPLAIYGGMPRDLDAAPLQAAAGLLLDRSFGLLPVAPVFVLALAGLVPLIGGRWPAAWPHLLVGAAVLAPLLRWRMWWGGQCPPGRFLVPLVPLLALAAAARTARGAGRGLARWRWALAALGIGLTLYMTARPEQMLLLNRRDRPTRVWDALSGQAQIGRYLPSLVSGQPEELRVALLWAGALLLLLLLDALSRRHEWIDRLFRGLGLPLALLLLVATAVDGWARAAPP